MRWIGALAVVAAACTGARTDPPGPDPAALDRSRRKAVHVIDPAASDRRPREDVYVTDLTSARIENVPHGDTLELPLAPGLSVLAKQMHIDRRGSGDFSWFGTTGTSGTGMLVISASGGRIFGTVIDGNRWDRLTSGPDGRLWVTRIPPKLGPVHPPLTMRQGEEQRHGEVPPLLVEAGPIEVIVAYTAAAESACSNIEAMIQNAVDLTTKVSAGSGVDTTFHLAHVYRTEFDESQYSLLDAVKLFKGKQDPELKEIHQLRDEHAADIAVLVVAPNGSSYDGLSEQTMATEDTAFSVVTCDTAASYLAMAHEIGHLLGLNDDDDRPDAVTFRNGYGYVHKSDNPEHAWRTVMVNPQACAGCTLVPRWSNPDRTYEGDATGAPDHSDSARVISRTAGAVSRFRQKRWLRWPRWPWR